MERTFMMVKPDGVERGLVGEVVQRMERKGFKLLAAKFMNVSRELADEHYAEHRGKGFVGELLDFITSGPVLAMVWSGEQVISVSRKLMGSTNPADAAPGTIRGDLATLISHNIVHGSDSVESAQREISIWFSESEISVS